MHGADVRYVGHVRIVKHNVHKDRNPQNSRYKDRYYSRSVQKLFYTIYALRCPLFVADVLV